MPLIDGKPAPLRISDKIAAVLFDNSKKWRYRALYGGRAAGKDWQVDAYAIEKAVRDPIRVLMTRELQTSIKDSSHRIVADTVNRLGYNQYFDVLDNEIRGKNGSLFLFRGIRHNTEEIKSMEGIDLCICDEAQKLTKESFTILDPTIRKPGSEVWFKFNPGYDDDFSYDFCVTNRPDNMIAAEVNYLDNPWCPAEMLELAERMRREDPALYENVWLGKPRGQGGRIFPMYDPTIHDIDFDLGVLPQCDLYMSIDPHRKYYPAIEWYAVTPSAMTVLYNEYPKYDDLGMWYDEARDVKTFDLSLEELANIILANDLTMQYGGEQVVRTGDPRFLNENPDLVRKLAEHGVTGWREAPLELIETQRENLKSMLAWNPALPMAGMNFPEFYFAKGERTRNARRATMRHCWSEDKDKESEKYKDFPDARRYWRSIMGEGVRYKGPAKPVSYEKLESGATAMLKHLPAQGYNR